MAVPFILVRQTKSLVGGLLHGMPGRAMVGAIVASSDGSNLSHSDIHSMASTGHIRHAALHIDHSVAIHEKRNAIKLLRVRSYSPFLNSLPVTPNLHHHQPTSPHTCSHISFCNPKHMPSCFFKHKKSSIYIIPLLVLVLNLLSLLDLGCGHFHVLVSVYRHGRTLNRRAAVGLKL